MTYEKPVLRLVDVIPIEHEGQPFALVRDPEDLVEQQVVLPLPMFMIATLFDGERDLREVQAEIQRQFGELFPTEALERLAAELDQHFLLDNERSRIRREDVHRAFARQRVRRPAHAGHAYPADAEECAKALDEFFASAAHGAAGDANGAGNGRGAPRGLVTPHIDVRQGGVCMARAFEKLRGSDAPDLYIILGVAHHPTPGLFTLTEKDFETPLGTAKTDVAAAARLKELYPGNLLAGEYAHKNEHSIEFQTIFLEHLHRGRRPYTILPILCGSFHEELENGGGSPRERAEVAAFVEAIKKIIAEREGRACVIAGVDLSHVGKKFGDEKGIDEFRAGLVRAADMRMLEQVRLRDAEGFFDHFRPDQNARNVDAVSAVYTMLQVLGGGEGELLGYEQYREAETDSMVTYASLALY